MLGAGPAILPVTGPTARRAKMGRNNGMDHRVCRRMEREHGDRATADKANTPSPVSDFRSAPPAHTGAPLVTPYLIRDAMVAESTAPGQRGQSPSQCWAPGHHVNFAVRHQSHSSTTLLSVPRRFRHRQEYKWWVPVDPSKAVALGVPAGPPRLGPRGSWREHCCRQAPVTWCHGTIIAPRRCHDATAETNHHETAAAPEQGSVFVPKRGGPYRLPTRLAAACLGHVAEERGSLAALGGTIARSSARNTGATFLSQGCQRLERDCIRIPPRHVLSAARAVGS